jgi:flagellar hook-associated protein 2
MSTSSITPLTISGVSSMSTQWQSVLNRAVSIASIPLTQLQNADTDVLQKKTLLSSMSTVVGKLGDTVANLGKIASGKALAATSSDTSSVTVQNTGAETAAAYTISDVTSIASAASATSTGFTSGAQVSTAGSMRLTFGGDGVDYQHDFTLTDNTVTGLRDKINSLQLGVTATVLTSGTKSYLSLAADDTGAVKNFSLVDAPAGAATELLTTKNLGSNAVFKINGIDVDRASNTVNDVVPGVSFTMLAKPSSSVKLTVDSNASSLSDAITSFVSSYNAMMDSVGAQVGQGAGLLSGSTVVREVQQDMRALASYRTDGAVKSLWDMGLEFDSSGKLSFDSTRFSALSATQVQGAIDFYGSETTGFGGLSQKFASLTDSLNGTIKLEQDGLSQTDKSLQSQISTLQDRINAMQASLSTKLQLADSLLASLESQKTMLTANVDSLNYVMYGKQTSA